MTDLCQGYVGCMGGGDEPVKPETHKNYEPMAQIFGWAYGYRASGPAYALSGPTARDVIAKNFSEWTVILLDAACTLMPDWLTA
jgi:hypothetical protein